MNNEELPDYKKNFLNEMQILRQQQLREQAPQQQSIISPVEVKAPPQIENNILNTAMYSGSNWRQQLNSTSYNRLHDLSHHQLNLMVNPEIARKQHNIQLTPISEYSNAMHNKTVFVNPKNISC